MCRGTRWSLALTIEGPGRRPWEPETRCAGEVAIGTCPLCGTRLPEGPQLEAHVSAELEALDGAEWTDITPADARRAPPALVSRRGTTQSRAARESARCGSMRRQPSQVRTTRQEVGRSCMKGRQGARRSVPAAVTRGGGAAEPAHREPCARGKSQRRSADQTCSGRRSRPADASTVRLCILPSPTTAGPYWTLPRLTSMANADLSSNTSLYCRRCGGIEHVVGGL